MKESILVDNTLHVKLFYEGSHGPLPEWFRKGNSCKLSSISMLENFPTYVMNRVNEMSNHVLKELKDIEFIKSKGCPPFSSNIIRFALMQRYTSRQSYQLLLDEMPLPSISLLKKLAQGGISPIKALMLLLQKGQVIVMLF